MSNLCHHVRREPRKQGKSQILQALLSILGLGILVRRAGISLRSSIPFQSEYRANRSFET